MLYVVLKRAETVRLFWPLSVFLPLQMDDNLFNFSLFNIFSLNSCIYQENFSKIGVPILWIFVVVYKWVYFYDLFYFILICFICEGWPSSPVVSQLWLFCEAVGYSVLCMSGESSLWGCGIFLPLHVWWVISVRLWNFRFLKLSISRNFYVSTLQRNYL